MSRGPDGRAPEIACDESGYEGEKLVGGETDVFAHASVLLAAAEAAGCIAELRRRIRSPAQEYKANHLLREKHRPVLLWLLGADGPIRGRARAPRRQDVPAPSSPWSGPVSRRSGADGVENPGPPRRWTRSPRAIMRTVAPGATTRARSPSSTTGRPR
jgi:hypothetical protein